MTSIINNSPILSDNTKRLSFCQSPRSTIILRELPESVFVKNPTTNLSLADEIKLLVISNQAALNSVYHFSVLNRLRRIVAVFRDETIAHQVYQLLSNNPKFGNFKIDLSTTLIRLDDTTNPQLSIDGHFPNMNNKDNDSFLGKYEEPMPVPSPSNNNNYEYEAKSTKTLLKPINLNIDTSCCNASTEELSPVSPSITLDTYE
ncbi:hypothetical protein DASC09_035660 [Saccharomycopsis crataegensis]|uniref:Calcipressin-like protein n=1 Tax=Saccharomycopsis crataegensis TaxID=43959 RepID=A0AAV5QNU1_9ASCO|nr:hypothetical protein DASC09_035660 [Saccharomycopsis crataegensis]